LPKLAAFGHYPPEHQNWRLLHLSNKTFVFLAL